MKKKGTLTTKLVTFFLLVGAIPLLTIGVISTLSSFNAISNAAVNLEDQIFQQLTAVRAIKGKQIQSYFRERKGDMEVIASNQDVIQAYQIMKNYPDESGATATSPIDVSTVEYQELWNQVDSRLSKYVKVYGYYDIFLICAAHGHVLYTNAKEADLGTNLSAGPYKNSPAAKAWKAATEGKIFIQDFEPYEPSGGEPASFVARPVKVDGEVVAVVMVQVPINQINNIMQERTGLGETGETYLVGPNYHMRSDSFLNKDYSVINSYVSDKTVQTKATKEAIAGNEGIEIIMDYNGHPVLSSFAPVDLEFFKWAVIAEIDKSEAFAQIYEIQADQQTVLITMIIIALVLLGVIVVAAIFISRSIIVPLKMGVDFAERIANKDLTHEIQINRNDEIGQLAESLNSMNRQLGGIVDNINQVSTHLAASSEEINASATSLSDGSQNQSASVEETSSSMEELSASIQQINANSTEMSTKSQNLQKISEESQATVNDAVDAMSKIKDSSVKIQEIIGVINDIADQTNLLSLNASIEAARAGEYGRGFAVVAQEISKLADRSAASTKEVQALMKETVTNVGNGVELVNRSGEAFQTIYDDVAANVSLIAQIADAISQQNAGAEQVQSAINSISDVAQSVSSSAEELSSSTIELQNQAEHLSAMIGEFKINETTQRQDQQQVNKDEPTEVQPVEQGEK